ncbi:MAG: molybdopterin-dependent oxidoreductase [Nitrospirae bacterium]|nr:molybdopterin-dependent oxidoreductase [Nitrospirota bacterium]
MGRKIARRDFLKYSSLLAATPFLDIATLRTFKKGPPDRVGTESVDTVTSVCEMCFWRCLIVGKVKNGRLVKLEGNPKSPSNGEKLCARGNAGIQLLYDPDRLKYPLKRIGKRGEGKWARISWEEAINTIAENMKRVKEKYGIQSLALFPHNASARYIMKFYEAIGSESITEPSIYQCRGNRDIGYKLTFGTPPGSPERIDLANTKLMLFHGTHLGENVHLSQCMEWIRGLGNGAKSIVVDPRFSTAASKADIWLGIRPGTDTALILAWINYLITNNLYDRDFVSRYCTGFEKLKEAVKHATLKWAERITDITAEKIKKAADLMAKHMPQVAVHPGRHSTWYGVGDTQRHRAMAILTAILGAYGKKGTLFLETQLPIQLGQSPCTLETEDEKKGELLREKWPYNLPGTPPSDLIEATISGKPYPIKAWTLWGQNLLETTPNPKRTIEAIQQLDFLLVVDVIPTPAALYADIILPEQTYLERYDVAFTYTNTLTPYISVRQPIVKPLYESKDPYWITKNIVEKMGYKECFPYNDIKENIEESLAPFGLSIEKINATGGVVTFPGEPYADSSNPLKFDTPSGKVELYSESMKEKGLDPVPRFELPEQAPKGFIRLVYGRSPLHTMSRTQNNAWLHNNAPENELWMNDKLARQIGVKNGEYLELENQDGVRSNKSIKVKVTPGIRPDCVFTQALYGSPVKMLSKAYNSGVADNPLFTKIIKDPLVGTVGMRVNFVRFIKNGKVLDMPEMISLPSQLKSAYAERREING